MKTMMFRLFWKEFQVLRTLWLVLFVVVVLISMYNGWIRSRYQSPTFEYQDLAPIIVAFGCVYLMAALAMSIGGEKEEQIWDFPIQRGIPLSWIMVIKGAFAWTSSALLTLVIYLTIWILAELGLFTGYASEGGLQNLIPLARNFLMYSLFFAVWTVIASFYTQSVIKSLLLTLVFLLGSWICQLFVFDDLIYYSSEGSVVHSIYLVLNVLTHAALMLAASGLFLFRESLQLFATKCRSSSVFVIKSSCRNSEQYTRPKAMWLHWQWLHAREQWPMIWLGVGVCFMVGLQPILTRKSPMLMEYYLWSAVLYILLAGCFVFAPEHRGKMFRFWNDRGLSGQLIVKSRLWRFFQIYFPFVLLSGFIYLISELTFGAHNPADRFQLKTLGLYWQDGPPSSLWREIDLYLTAEYICLIVIPVSCLLSMIFTSIVLALSIGLVVQLLLIADAVITVSLFHVPMWLSMGPLALALWRLLLQKSYQRFGTEVGRKFYAAIFRSLGVSLMVNLGLLAFFRVYEVPDVDPNHRVGNGAYEISTGFLQEPTYQPPSRETTIVRQFRDLSTKILPTRSADLQHSSILVSYEKHLVACLGWNYLRPILQQQTIEQQPIALELRSLVLATSYDQLSKEYDEIYWLQEDSFKFQDLLLRAAKYQESLGELAEAATYYIAINRLSEFELMSGLNWGGAAMIRSTLKENLISWVSHPKQTAQRVKTYIHLFLQRPFNHLSNEELATLWYRQMYQFYVLKESFGPSQEPNNLTAMFASLPTEQWRLQRLLKFAWRHQLEVPVYLELFGSEESTLRVDENSRDHFFREFESHQDNVAALTQRTLGRNLVFHNLSFSSNRFPWKSSERMMVAECIATGRLVWAILNRFNNPQPLSLTQIQTSLFSHRRKLNEIEGMFYSTIANVHYFEIDLPATTDFTFEPIGLHYMMGQRILSARKQDIVPYQFLNEWSALNDGRIQFNSENSVCALVLPDLDHPPPIPDYDAIGKMTYEELNAYFRSVAVIDSDHNRPPSMVVPIATRFETFQLVP